MGKFQLPEQLWTSKNDQNDDTLDYLGQTFQWDPMGGVSISNSQWNNVTSHARIYKFGFDPNLATSRVVRTAGVLKRIPSCLGENC